MSKIDDAINKSLTKWNPTGDSCSTIAEEVKKAIADVIDNLDENSFVLCEVCDSVSALDEEIIAKRIKEVLKQELCGEEKT